MDFRLLPALDHQKLKRRYTPRPSNCAWIRWSLVAIGIFVLTGLVQSTCAGNATNYRSLLLRRIVRDISSIMKEETRAIDATDSIETKVNLPQPQGQCLLDGVLVAESTVFCEKQAGCRAIQKTGYCCPNYKCDCEKNGRTYSNGDKLVDPETPCTVCYCQGGEILCSSVTCFHRDDCKPKFVPRRCCPEYDNCPVSSAEPRLASNKTIAYETESVKSDLAVVNNPKITIKETTKPIEIRITDDNKAVSIQQITNSPTALSLDAIKNKSSTIVSPLSASNNHHVPLGMESMKTNVMSTTNSKTNVTPTLIIEKSDMDGIENPIQSVIATVTASENEVPNDASKVNKREYLITTEPDDYTKTADSYSDGNANSRAVLNPEYDILRKTSSEMDPDTAGSENIYHIIMTTNGPQITDPTSWRQIANSTNKSKNVLLPMSTTEAWPIEEFGLSDNNITTSRPDSGKNTTEKTTGLSQTTLAVEGIQHMEDDEIATPLESNPAYPSLPIEDFSLRDVNFPLSETDDNTEDRDEPRSISASHIKPKVTTSHIDEFLADGSGSGMITQNISPTSDVFRESTTKGNMITFPDKIELMLSAEDSSEETSVSNNTDFHSEQLMKEIENEAGSGEPLNLDSVVMVPNIEFGSGEPLKEMTNDRDKTQKREPTTPRPIKRPFDDIDLDDLKPNISDGKLEPLDDPKLDVESLKLDENDNTDFTNSKNVANGNAITIKLNPQNDKLLEELETIFNNGVVGTEH